MAPMIATLSRWLPWLLFLLLLGTVTALHRDVPYHDQWDLLPLLVAAQDGSLSLATLLAPHNGHVLFFPKLLMLGLATATGWHTYAEVLCSLALGLVNYWLLLALLGIPALPVQLQGTTRTGLAVVVFSMAQADNWLWGWQLQVPLCMAAVLAGCLALQRIRSAPLACLLAAGCGLVASGSFAAGMVFWPAALPLVLQRQRLLALPWLLLTGLVAFAYLQLLGATPPLPHQDTDTALGFYSRLGSQLAGHTLVCLGSLAARFDLLAAGLAGLLGLGWLASLHLSAPAQSRPLLRSLSLFSLGACLLVALSRGGMGLEQMLSSRYATLSVPFWACLLTLLLTDPRLGRSIGTALLLCLLANSLYSYKDMQRLHQRLAKGELALSEPGTAAGSKALRVINPRPDPARARAEVDTLRQHQWSYFRTHPSTPDQ